MELDRAVQVAQAAARAAGDYAHENIAAESYFKECDNSIVTAIDVKCQEMIIEKLRAEFPEFGIIAEEPDEGSGQMLLNIPPNGDVKAYWVIDPIDGTRNFAYGMPYFCVSIGLLVDGMPAAGVVYYPDCKRMYHAVAGGKAYCDQTEIHVKQDTIHANTQIAVSGLIHEDWSWQQIEAVFQGCVHANLGSAALHMAYVAGGQYSVGIFPRTKLWDVAGGAAIVYAAGGIITDYRGKEIFPFDCDGYDGSKVKTILGCPDIVKDIVNRISNV